MAHDRRELRRQNAVHAAEIEAEIDVLQDIPGRIDGEYGEEQPRRAEGIRVAEVEEDDRAQDRQPQRDNDPVDQSGSESHGGSMLRDANPHVMPRVS
jgi:hypothetical protein